MSRPSLSEVRQTFLAQPSPTSSTHDQALWLSDYLRGLEWPTVDAARGPVGSHALPDPQFCLEVEADLKRRAAERRWRMALGE